MNRMMTLRMISFIAAIVAVGVPNSRAEDKSTPPAIVKVRSYDSAAEGGKPADEGLGFIVESQGLILTNYQVLQNRRTKALRQVLKVELVDGGKTFPASIVGVEPTLNFAILKVEADEDLPESKLCPRDGIAVGQKVRALAGFKDDQPIYAKGEISDLNSKECYQESMTATMLRATIEIPKAGLGGPVFNEKGEVVAIFTGHEPADNSGGGDPDLDEAGDDPEHEEMNRGKIHLLPIFLVSTIYESLKLKKSLRSPWTGFSVRPLTDEERKRFPYKRYRSGVGIEHVWEKGPAETMGVRKDDILVGFSYYRTNTVAEFQRWLYAHGVGMEVKLYFLRNGDELLTVPYKIEERPSWAIPK